VTIRFFGDLDQDAAEAALAALVTVAGSRGPVCATGGPDCRLLNPGLIAWPVAGLEALAAAVSAATAALGRPPEARPFRGHVTLARARRGTDLRGRPRVLPALTATWAVTTIDLVESVLGPEGARYHTRAEVPLGPP
jgi:2'-5' RNA ligase